MCGRFLSFLYILIAGLILCCDDDPVGPESANNYIDVPLEQPTIQAGILTADDGDTVMVADGIYTGEGNRDIVISGKSIVLLSQNGPEVTIINCQGSESEPHRGFLIDGGPDTVITIIGFTICNGYAPVDSEIPTSHGGGVLCRADSAVLSNCIIEDCYAANGGGVFVGGRLIICDCILGGNKAVFGAGISCDSLSSLSVLNCVFHYNSAYEIGGGVYAYLLQLICDSCLFLDNNADWLGGAIFSFKTDAEITYSIFAFNTAQSMRIPLGGLGGGAVLCAKCNPIIDHCTFYQNTIYAGQGAAFSGTESQPSFTDCLIYDNCTGIHQCNTINDAFIECCNVYGNVAGDYLGEIENMTGVNGNISDDPKMDSDFYISADSPCAPENNECGVVIGARGVKEN